MRFSVPVGCLCGLLTLLWGAWLITNLMEGLIAYLFTAGFTVFAVTNFLVSYKMVERYHDQLDEKQKQKRRAEIEQVVRELQSEKNSK